MVTAQPLIATVTTNPTAEVAAWAPVVSGQTQASQLEAAEAQYATCYAYAGLDQGLVGNAVRTNPGLVQSCSTTGLTQAEVRLIQELIKAAS